MRQTEPQPDRGHRSASCWGPFRSSLAVCILLPLWLTRDRVRLAGAGSLFTFCIAIGLGFMLIETSQMQRLIIALGHPTYGLSVVLFALLYPSGPAAT